MLVSGISEAERESRDRRIFVQRRAVTLVAADFLGTPYHHGAQLIGVGIDCAHLLAAVYGSTGLVDVGTLPEYGRDWFLHGATDLLRTWVARYCVEVPRATIGDIALYRYGRFASHAAIVVATDPLEVVHAFRGRGVVREEADVRSPLFARLDSYWTLSQWAQQ